MLDVLIQLSYILVPFVGFLIFKQLDSDHEHLETIPIFSYSDFFIDSSLEQQKKIADRINDVLKDVGFFVLTDFPFNITSAEMWTVTNDFFNLPLHEKQKVPMTDTYPYGYQHLEILSKSESTREENVPDLKESFQIMMSSQTFPSDDVRWPENLNKFKEEWIQDYRRMEKLSDDLWEIFELALDLPPGYFQQFVQKHQSVLRGIHYPQINQEPDNIQMRCSEHSDWGAFTLLRQDTSGGLQLKSREGAWINVDIPPNSISVNIGDMFQRWTNDVWVSTKHRVVVPQDVHSRGERISFAYFILLSPDVMVSCLQSDNCGYPPINANDFLMEQHKKATAGV